MSAAINAAATAMELQNQVGLPGFPERHIECARVRESDGCPEGEAVVSAKRRRPLDKETEGGEVVVAEASPDGPLQRCRDIGNSLD